MRTTPAHGYALNNRTAIAALLALASVDIEMFLMAALAAAPVMADEDFGGIGVTIYQVPAGVYVAEVIPGGPAADTKLATGDIIIAIDGVSLKGQNIEFSKSQIRGQVNKPLEITYTSEGESYTTVIRRAQITVKDLEAKRWNPGTRSPSSTPRNLKPMLPLPKAIASSSSPCSSRARWSLPTRRWMPQT